MTIYGGVSFHLHMRKLRGCPEIIVACPGRLLDHLQEGSLNLRSLEILVLDEADQMFDMGFLPDIKKIISYLPENRQTLLFSATMPEEIRDLTKQILKNPQTLKISADKPLDTIEHSVYFSTHEQKTPLLFSLLNLAQGGPVIVFTRTKQRAIRLSEQIMRTGLRATSLQGNLSQGKRQLAMDGFRKRTFSSACCN